MYIYNLGLKKIIVTLDNYLQLCGGGGGGGGDNGSGGGRGNFGCGGCDCCLL